jgi:membrane-associated PAP2 superfamily phosphatase
MSIAEETRLSTAAAVSSRLPILLAGLTESRRPSFRVLRMIGLVAVLLSATLGIAGTLQWLKPPDEYSRDFVQIYVMARSFAAGQDLYRPVADAAPSFGVPTKFFPYPAPHPPTLGLVLVPLASLNYGTAEVCWLGVQVGCLLLALYLLARRFYRQKSRATLVGLAILCLAWRPVQADLQWGNVDLMLLALLSGAGLCIHRSKREWAGGLLGLSMLIKPVAWPILLGLVVRRDWRAASAAVAVGVVGLSLCALLVGLNQPIAYVTRVLPEVSAIYQTSAGNISLASVAWHAFKGATTGELSGQRDVVALPVVASPLVAEAASIALPVIATGLGLLLAGRWKSAEWSFALLVALSVEVSPISWDLYEMFLILPIALVVVWLRDHGYPARPTLAFGLIALTLIVPWGRWVQLMYALAGRSVISAATPVPPLPGLLLSVPAMAVCALIGLVVYLGGRDEQVESTSEASIVPASPRP